MNADEARSAYDAAIRKAHELTGRIASAEKQVRTGTAKSASIADRTLPGLRRQLQEAEIAATMAQPYLRQRAFTPAGNFKINPRTTPLTDEELAEMDIPPFLRRAKCSTARAAETP